MTRANLITGLLIAGLLIFMAPAWTGLLALITGQFRGDTALGRMFYLFLFADTPVWGLIKTGLGAGIAIIAGVGFTDRLNLNASWVVIAILVMFVPLVVLFFVLMDPKTGREIWQLADQTDIGQPVESATAFAKVWNAYLSSQVQILAGHLALFFGLKKAAAS